MSLKSVRKMAMPTEDCCRDLDRDITGYIVVGKSETIIGKVVDILTESEKKVSRYMVVDTTIAPFSTDGKSIVVPVCTCRVNHDERRVASDITPDMVRMAPAIEDGENIDRDTERELHSVFGVSPYWAFQAGQEGVDGFSTYGF